MKSRTLSQIKDKIENGEATVLTAEEVSRLVKEGNKPGFDDVDVVTTGTCGINVRYSRCFTYQSDEPGSLRKPVKSY